jgi:hypothetical protein
VLCVAAFVAACVVGCSTEGSSSSSTSLSPPVVQQFVAVKQATDNLTRVINLMAAADGTTRLFAQSRLGSSSAKSLLDGARLGWNNVVVGLNSFTPAQATAVRGLTGLVLRHRLIAIHWQNALDGLEPGYTRTELRRALAKPQREELAARGMLREVAATLAKTTCDLEVKYHELASASQAASACATAEHL